MCIIITELTSDHCNLIRMENVTCHLIRIGYISDIMDYSGVQEKNAMYKSRMSIVQSQAIGT